MDYYGVALRSEPREVTGGWRIEIECPWSAEHSGEAPRDTVVSFIAGLGNGFKCFHSHCAQRHWRELRAELERRSPGLTPYFGKLPSMTHSDIARVFAESHDDFVRIYDLENATGVWIPGSVGRWVTRETHWSAWQSGAIWMNCIRATHRRSPESETHGGHLSKRHLWLAF